MISETSLQNWSMKMNKMCQGTGVFTLYLKIDKKRTLRYGLYIPHFDGFSKLRTC